MTRTTTPKPTDSAKPTTGKPASNLFNAFDPATVARVADANLYNSYNGGMTRQMMADQRNDSYFTGQAALQQNKEAAGFGVSLGNQSQEVQSANQAASQQAAAQQNTLGNFSSSSGVGQGAGTLAFGGMGGQNVAQAQNNNAATQQRNWEQNRARENFQQQLVTGERDRYNQQLLANNAATNQVQQTALQQRGDQSLAQIQGANQLEAARIAANAQLGAANVGAQSNMVSSLFGSLGNMTASIGGGGGRRGYW